jgi:hypothetical protein
MAVEICPVRNPDDGLWEKVKVRILSIVRLASARSTGGMWGVHSYPNRHG